MKIKKIIQNSKRTKKHKMNLIPAIRFAIFISNGLKFYLAHDFLPKESEITYEFTVFRLETKILLRNIYPVFPPNMICNSFRKTISLYIYLLFTGKSSIDDAVLK